jgi:cell division protease FtsH
MLNQLRVATAYAKELAELALALSHGHSCLVECDKDLTQFLCAEMRARLASSGLVCMTADGRPTGDELDWGDVGVIEAMLAQLRKAVRSPVRPCVIIVPHLDVLAALVGGLSPEAREIIPLLYEVPEQMWLAFRDSSLPLLPVVEKRFTARYDIQRCAEAREWLAPGTAAEMPSEASAAEVPPSG